MAQDLHPDGALRGGGRSIGVGGLFRGENSGIVGWFWRGAERLLEGYSSGRTDSAVANAL